MLIIRNTVKDLTENELNVVLQPREGNKARGYVGQSLRNFIEGEMLTESTSITELYDELTVFNLAWPFRKLNISVEVTLSRGFEIAVLDDEVIDALQTGTLEQIDEIDPSFKLKEAYAAVVEEAENCNPQYDYAIFDDEYRTIVDWDD